MKERWVFNFFDEPDDESPPGTTMHRVYLAGEADTEIARLKQLAHELVDGSVYPFGNASARWGKIKHAEIDREGA